MGMIPAPEKCFLTDLPTEDFPSSIHSIDYVIRIKDRVYLLSFHSNHSNSDFVNNNKHILKGLLINNKFPHLKNDTYYSNERLEKIIKEAQVPELPKSKLDNLMIFLQDIQDYPGAKCDLSKVGKNEYIIYKLYFKNNDEYWFYLKTLKEEGLITFIDVSGPDGSGALDIRITYKGLNYLMELEAEGIKSNYCFVAMSFSKEHSELRQCIKQVIRDSGYEPLIVDEQHYDSEMTINDAIVKYIRMSKFLIADFTDQKHGVYFEAGFALGLKRKVIYTCLENDFKKSHFDTNHYPHIVYKNLDELRENLKNKIQAWID